MVQKKQVLTMVKCIIDNKISSRNISQKLVVKKFVNTSSDALCYIFSYCFSKQVWQDFWILKEETHMLVTFRLCETYLTEFVCSRWFHFRSQLFIQFNIFWNWLNLHRGGYLQNSSYIHTTLTKNFTLLEMPLIRVSKNLGVYR